MAWDDEDFELRLAGSPHELEGFLGAQPGTARMTAGFCWVAWRQRRFGPWRGLVRARADRRRWLRRPPVADRPERTVGLTRHIQI
ncbi:hypothetical protein OUY22_07695 [Nonomuraea sp. MCN248]|uniref:Uncharacterized protein n=1 Tax=Nonomuraea corallina TaxID=2989783 RepID=A0ABT4S8P7_9ACTN|nr:hypothetical protein [Nonomuraea corallina]MDA0633300.1 hypothetical protein [Nonomuraea corallina]